MREREREKERAGLEKSAAIQPFAQKNPIWRVKLVIF